MRREFYEEAPKIAAKTISHITNNKKYYGAADARLVFVKVGNDMKLFWGRIDLLHRNDSIPKDENHDYGDILLTRFTISLEELVGALQEISDGKQPILKGRTTSVSGSASLHSLSSRTRYGYINHIWPFQEASFAPESFQLPSGLADFAKKGLPTYPDIYAATSEFLTLEPRLQSQSSDRRLLIVMPDYRVRISGIKVSGKRVSLEVECKESNYQQLTCKMYIANDSSSFQSGDLDFDVKGRASCKSTIEPDSIHAYVLDENDDVLDTRQNSLKWSYYSPDLIIETPSLKILEMVKRGETDEVEFKARLGEKDNKMSDEFLESLASFANTKGGVILLGVDDNCNVIGTDEDVGKLTDRITHRMPTAIEPADIKFQVESVEIDEQRVVLIRVFEGEHKPYIMKGKGILVRSNSSDRAVTRAELDIIYQDRNRSRGNFPNYI